MDAFLAFVRDNANAVLGFLAAILAAGGAGTLVLKRFLGERERPPPPPPPLPPQIQPDIHVTASHGSDAVFNQGRGNVTITRNASRRVTPELARDLGLSNETTIKAECQLADRSADHSTYVAQMHEIAERWHASQDVVRRLVDSGNVDVATQAALEAALRDVDLETVDRLCRQIEATAGSGTAADRSAG